MAGAFTKCAGCQLITSLPMEARTTRFFEVAAVVDAAWPGGGAPARAFVHCVVCEWHLLLVSLAQPHQLLAVIPWLAVREMDAQAAVATELGDPTLPSQRVRLGGAGLRPRRQQQQQQQQQQAASPPWQRPASAGACVPLQAVDPAAGRLQQLKGRLSCAAAQVEHVGTSSSLGPAAGPPPPPPQQQQGEPPCHSLELLTVERRSRLVFHLHQAWVGAHMRAALASSGAAGLPRSWLPPSQRRACSTAAPAARPAPALATLHEQADACSTPAAAPSVIRAGAADIWRRAGEASPRQLQHVAVESSSPSSSDSGSGESRAPAWDGGAAHACAAAGSRPGTAEGSQASSAWPRAGWLWGASSRPASRGRPCSPSTASQLRSFMQPGAGVLAQPTASAARELLWGLAEGLLRPCSLFESADEARMQLLTLEVGASDHAGALQRAFFASQQIMTFIVARLTSWGALLALFGDGLGLPPIQNPAKPGALEAWAGRPVLWSTALTYAERPRRLLPRLALTARSPVCFRLALAAAHAITERHQLATARARARGSSSSASSGRGEPPLVPSSYYADPLNLSPMLAAGDRYTFVARACSMAGGADPRRRSSSSSNGGGAMAAALGAAQGPLAADSDSEDEASWDSSSMAEATAILRWERLAGRLAARLATRKVAALLRWLHTQLAFSTGCSGVWLSNKALDAGHLQAGPASPPFTFHAATKQLIASMLTLRLPGLPRGGGGSGSAPAGGPAGVNDVLWWAQGSSGGAGAAMLDDLVSVLWELTALCQHEERLLRGEEWTPGTLLEALREVPARCLQRLVRALFLRLICLAAGSAHHVHAPAAVLAHRYACLLLEVLGGVVGAAGSLHAAFAVEVQHLLGAPQVAAQLHAAAAAGGPRAGVLARLNAQLLQRVLAAMRAAGGAPPGQRCCSQQEEQLVLLQQQRHTGTVLKVQN